MFQGVLFDGPHNLLEFSYYGAAHLLFYVLNLWEHHIVVYILPVNLNKHLEVMKITFDCHVFLQFYTHGPRRGTPILVLLLCLQWNYSHQSPIHKLPFTCTIIDLFCCLNLSIINAQHHDDLYLQCQHIYLFLAPAGGWWYPGENQGWRPCGVGSILETKYYNKLGWRLHTVCFLTVLATL